MRVDDSYHDNIGCYCMLLLGVGLNISSTSIENFLKSKEKLQKNSEVEITVRYYTIGLLCISTSPI